MEHRWGRRCEFRYDVRLRTVLGAVVSARVRDISLSGAYLESRVSIAVMQPIEVELSDRVEGRARARTVSASVVRRDASGIGVEWSDFAPEPVCELLAPSLLDRSAPWDQRDLGRHRAARRS